MAKKQEHGDEQDWQNWKPKAGAAATAEGPIPTAPLALGTVLLNGTKANGSNNWTVAWNAGTSAYEITIAGENYFWLNYVTNVTPMADSQVTVWTGSIGGKLTVRFRNVSGGGLVQSHFQFVTFKL